MRSVPFTKRIVRDDLRSQAIKAGLEFVSAAYKGEAINVLELGVMYDEAQGLTTYRIAEFLSSRPAGGSFVSIEWDQSHIDAARAIIRRRAPELEARVSFRLGHSLSVMPGVLAEFGTVHLALLDAGEHAEVCLQEFELVLPHLAPQGVIIFDDAQEIPHSNHYSLPLPLGKLTLVLPMLIIQNYLGNRDAVRTSASDPADPATVPNSRFVNQLQTLDLQDNREAAFCVMGRWHKMLAYGPPAFIEKAAPLTDVGLLRQAAGKLAVRLGIET